MRVRLIPYSEVFVSITLTLDEAVELADALHIAKTAPALTSELEAALGRAAVRKGEANAEVQNNSQEHKGDSSGD